MWPFARPLEALQEDDLRGLIGRLENASLDFKGPAYKPGEENRALLRDVVSLANAEGGAIVVGMREDREARATQLAPIPNAEREIKRMTDLCLAHIADRIPGFKIDRIPTDGGDVIVIRVPRSYRRPHMVTLDQATDFWARHGRQNAEMSVEEIRTAFATRTDSEMKVEAFLSDRRQARESLTGQEPSLFMTATPMLLDDGRIDIHNPNLHALLRRPSALHASQDVAPTLRGLRNATDKDRTLEVFRNGHVEFFQRGRQHFTRQGPTTEWFIRGAAISQYLGHFVTFVAAVREECDLGDPFAVALTLFSCYGMYLEGPAGGATRWIESGHLFVPPLTFPREMTAEAFAQALADRLWHASAGTGG